MKRFFTLICLGFSAASIFGCGSSAKPEVAKPAPVEQIAFQLEGTWQGEMMIDETAAKAVPPDFVKVVDTLRDMKMNMTFREDKTLTLTGETKGQPYTSENTWDYVGDEDNKLTIKTINEDGIEKKEEFFVNDNNSFDMPLVIEANQVGAMRFKRLR